MDAGAPVALPKGAVTHAVLLIWWRLVPSVFGVCEAPLDCKAGSMTGAGGPTQIIGFGEELVRTVRLRCLADWQVG